MTAADLPLFKDGVIMMNSGHLPWEIDVEGLRTDAARSPRSTRYVDGITTLHLGDGRAIHVLTHGHMVNLAGPRPLGNSIESMDLGFTLQARCLEAVANGSVPMTSCVVPVPAAHRRPGRVDVRGPRPPRLSRRRPRRVRPPGG